MQEIFCESLKESRAIENIPVNELDLLFVHIFHLRKDRWHRVRSAYIKRLPAKYFNVTCMTEEV